MDYLNLSAEVLPLTGEIPRPTLLRSIRNAAIHFAKESRLLTQDYAAQVVTNSTVTLTAPTGTRIYAVNEVSYQNQPAWYESQDATVKVHSSIQDNHTVDLEAVLIPTRDSTFCDDRIMDTWYEGIVAGAVANILSMRNEKWFDPNMAAQYGASYQAALDRAKDRKDNNDKRGVRIMSYGGL